MLFWNGFMSKNIQCLAAVFVPCRRFCESTVLTAVNIRALKIFSHLMFY